MQNPSLGMSERRQLALAQVVRVEFERLAEERFGLDAPRVCYGEALDDI